MTIQLKKTTRKSKVQDVVATSSAKVEYRAMAPGAHQLLWLKRFMQDIHLLQMEFVLLHCDNKAAISITHNPIQNDRTKHIEIDSFFIKENNRDDYSLIDQLYIFNKLFYSFVYKMSMTTIYTCTILKGSIDTGTYFSYYFLFSCPIGMFL